MNSSRDSGATRKLWREDLECHEIGPPFAWPRYMAVLDPLLMLALKRVFTGQFIASKIWQNGEILPGENKCGSADLNRRAERKPFCSSRQQTPTVNIRARGVLCVRNAVFAIVKADPYMHCGDLGVSRYRELCVLGGPNTERKLGNSFHLGPVIAGLCELLTTRNGGG